MYYPQNNIKPATRALPLPTVAAMSSDLTRALLASLEAQRNHDALVRRAAAVLPTLEV